MRRYLVVAHRTLGGSHLVEHLHHLRDEDPYCRFHVLVPIHHPGDHAWTEFEVEETAQQVLDEMLNRMASMGMGATGEIGNPSPVVAIADAMRHQGVDSFTGIVLSTLPRRISRWWDVPHRIARSYPSIPLTHLVAEDAAVT